MSVAFIRGENPLRADKLNQAFSERVSRDGDTMLGMLQLARDPVVALDAATKQYVDMAKTITGVSGALNFWGTSTTINDYDAQIYAANGATLPGNPGQGDLNYLAGSHRFQAFDGTTQFRVGSVPAAYEFWEASAGSRGTAAVLRSVNEIDADCDGVIDLQGQGAFRIGNGTGVMLSLPSIGAPVINYLEITSAASNGTITLNAVGGDGLPGNISLNAHYFGQVSFGNNNGTLGVFADPGTTGGLPRTSYFVFTAGKSGNAPQIGLAGATNETLRISSSGTGQLSFATGRGTGMVLLDPAAAVSSFISMQAGASGSSAIIKANAGNLFLGNSGQATNATTGFVQIPTCNGTPTGVPANAAIGATLVVDSSTTKLWVYVNSAWKSVTLV